MSLITSILTGGINNHETTAEEANGLSTDFVAEGIVGTIANTSGVAPATGGFAVNATGTPDTNIQITAGIAWVTATPSTQGSQTIRIKNSATITQAISANISGSTKYDWVYLSISAANANAPNTAGDNVASISVSRSSSAATDDGTPPTYAILLAVVTVSNGFSTITNSTIRDRRSQCTLGATSDSPDSFWTTGGLPAVSSVTENGNRSASMTYASSVANILTPGMRLRTSRTVAAPTQSTLLNGTTQYYSKASPNKLTFTDDFVVSAWVKLTSYTAGSVASRYNGTSGWQLLINGSGQVILNGFNAGAANYSQVVSYQSLPLNRWVHIAAQLDMSSFTATTTTSYVMIDGTDLPCSVGRGGTNPTALVQAGDLQIGAANGSSFFPGAIAQVAIYNAKVTQANIRATKNQTLSGSETSIASAYSFNNVITDLNTTTPNDLTANGSAVATNASSPFTTDANGTSAGTYDWGIVTKVATTVATVQYPEGCAIPTSGGISTVDYSGVKSPFGMPTSVGRWKVDTYLFSLQQTTPVSLTWYNLNAALTVPVGDWVLDYVVCAEANGTATSYYVVSATLSDANNTASDKRMTTRSGVITSATTTNHAANLKANDTYTATSATVKYLNSQCETLGGSLTLYNRGDNTATRISATLAYL